MKHFFSFILFAIILHNAMAQQIPQLSLRHKNPVFFNPAASGASVYSEVSILHRQQWVGFENAPTTSFASYSTTLGSTNGLGIFLINDRTYPGSRITANISYAYIINMGNNNLAFGLSALIMQYRLSNDGLTYRDISDPVYEFNSETKWRPESNMGIMLYSTDYYFGFAINQMLRTSFRPFSANDYAGIKMSRHLLLAGQYDFRFSNHRISPGLFLSYAKSSPMVSEISTAYLFDHKIYSNLAYKFGDGINMAIGYRYDRFSLIYSFDIITSGLRTHTSGSHEVQFSADIGFNQKSTPPMFSSGTKERSKRFSSGKRVF